MRSQSILLVLFAIRGELSDFSEMMSFCSHNVKRILQIASEIEEDAGPVISYHL